MANENNAAAGGCFGGGLGLLAVGTFLLFLGLKLGEVGVVAGWSWWWVTAPLWIYFGLIATILSIILVILFIVLGIKLIAGS